MPTPVSKNNEQIPTSLASPGAVRFWLAVCLIGTANWRDHNEPEASRGSAAQSDPLIQ
jgi:hypothetical protein